jgi:hypothetical protein
VAYRPVAKRRLQVATVTGQRLGNTLPLLGSRFLIMQQLDYNNGNWVFLRGPCRDVINKGQSQLSGSSVREAVKRNLVARVLSVKVGVCNSVRML